MKKSGWAHQKFLDSAYVLPVGDGDVVQVQELRAEIADLQHQVVELETELDFAMEEIVHNQEAIEPST